MSELDARLAARDAEFYERCAALVRNRVRPRCGCLIPAHYAWPEGRCVCGRMVSDAEFESLVSRYENGLAYELYGGE